MATGGNEKNMSTDKDSSYLKQRQLKEIASLTEEMEDSEMVPKVQKKNGKKKYLKTDQNSDSQETEIRIRQPIRYSNYSINSKEDSPDREDETKALLSRYRYYTRLAPHSNSSLQMPDHVVPANYIIQILVPRKDRQNSIITIFALWNTMMGTSLLSMPWAIKQAGFICGICLLIGMAGLMFYTSYRVLRSIEGIPIMGEVVEFSDVCRHYLGRWSEVVAISCSFLTLLGGAVVYWILMSNFMYNVVTFIYYKVHTASNFSVVVNSSDFPDAVCPHPDGRVHNYVSNMSGRNATKSVFQKVWDEQQTVPFFLIVILWPLLNFKSPTFFTKFNALGTLSVAYLSTFAAVKASKWGFHVNFSIHNNKDPDFVSNFELSFPALTGVASLAYFVQNCLLAIVRNQKHPENNARDLSIAYVLVAVTYIYMGVMFYASFPLAKSCVEDNLLNNISTNDVMAFVARIGLFFQMAAVLPLLLYIIRLQFMHSVFKSVWPSWKHVVVLNLLLVGTCVLFAVFLPHIGKIISFVGAFCGFSYAICLPCLVYMKSCHLGESGETLTWPKLIFHSFLIVAGLANFIGQFLIIGHTA